MSFKVTIAHDSLDPNTWIEHETDDLCALLKEQFEVFPATARIYQGSVAQINDVTPVTHLDIERLQTLDGPFFVIIYPDGPLALIIIIGAIIAVAAYALAPSAPSIQAVPAVAQRNQQTASPNNELSERQNRPRINGRIPDIFGEVRSTPDLIATPYRIFEAGREVEYAYMCVGRGYYDVGDIRDGETLCSNIPGVSVNLYAPYTSPNSGDTPQLTIGGPVNSEVLSVKRSNSVNGQVLRPPNSATLVGVQNIAFGYPGTIRYTVVPGANPATPGFSSLFAEGDSLTISGAVQTAVSTFLVNALVNVVAQATPVPISGYPTAFQNGMLIQFSYGGVNPPTTPPIGLEIGATITLTQYVDPAVADYHISTITEGEKFGTDADMSGTYTILDVNTYIGQWGGVVFTVLLDDPGAVNPNWDLLTYGITFYGTGPANNRLGISIGGIATLPAFDLDGTYTVVAITEDTIVLNNPAGTNSDWNILDTIAGDVSPPMSPTLSASGNRWIGPFVLDLSSANSVFANFVASNGMYKDDGTTQVASDVDILLEVTPVDSTDTPTGVAETSQIVMSGSSTLKETVAFTLKQTFLNFTGRFRVRATRLTERDTAFTGQVVDEIRWRDVYAVAPVTQTDFGYVTTVHAKTFATSSALAVKERKLSLLATRLLPTRIGATSTFDDVTLVATKRADDIFCAICRDNYIGNRRVEELDVDSIYDTVAAVETYFGTTDATEFCYTFDNDNLSFEETANIVAGAVFSVAYRRGNIIKLSLEKETPDSTLLFNHRNKIPGSEKRSVSFGYQDDNDGIEYTYVDPDKDAIITVFLPEAYPAINPKKIESVGIRNHLQAYFHSWRIWNKIRYKNTVIEFDATQEADLLVRNDRILVADGTRPNVQDGEVLSIATLTLTLSQNVDLTVYASYVIFLQHVDGTVESIGITAGSNANQVILAGAPALSLAVDPEGYTRTAYVIIGNTESQQTAFLVDEKSPVRGLVSTVKASNYDARYYANDTDFITSVIGSGGYGSGGGGVVNSIPPYALPLGSGLRPPVYFHSASSPFTFAFTTTSLTTSFTIAVPSTLIGRSNVCLSIVCISDTHFPRTITINTYGGQAPDSTSLATTTMYAGAAQARGFSCGAHFTESAFVSDTIVLSRPVNTEGTVNFQAVLIAYTNAANNTNAVGLPTPFIVPSSIDIVTNPVIDMDLDDTVLLQGDMGIALSLRSNYGSRAFGVSGGYTTFDQILESAPFAMRVQLHQGLVPTDALGATYTFTSPQTSELGAVNLTTLFTP